MDAGEPMNESETTRLCCVCHLPFPDEHWEIHGEMTHLFHDPDCPNWAAERDVEGKTNYVKCECHNECHARCCPVCQPEAE